VAQLVLITRRSQQKEGRTILFPLGPGWDRGKLLDALRHVFLSGFSKGITPLTPVGSLNLSLFSGGFPVELILLPSLGGVNIE
jgi:hypothetical protein